MKVKICGITRLEDAELAAIARRVGDRLHPVAEPSKRYVEPGVAAGIARRLRRKIELVGVFVNQPLDEIAGLVDVLGLSTSSSTATRARRSARRSRSARARR